MSRQAYLDVGAFYILVVLRYNSWIFDLLFLTRDRYVVKSGQTWMLYSMGGSTTFGTISWSCCMGTLYKRKKYVTNTEPAGPIYFPLNKKWFYQRYYNAVSLQRHCSTMGCYCNAVAAVSAVMALLVATSFQHGCTVDTILSQQRCSIVTAKTLKRFPNAALQHVVLIRYEIHFMLAEGLWKLFFYMEAVPYP